MSNSQPPQPPSPTFSRRYVTDSAYQADAQLLLRTGWRVHSVRRDVLGIIAIYAQTVPQNQQTARFPTSSPSARPTSPTRAATTGLHNALYVDAATQRRSWKIAAIVGGGVIVLGLVAALCSAVLSPPTAGGNTNGGTNAGSASLTSANATATTQAYALELDATATAIAQPTATPVPTATATPAPTKTPAPPPPPPTSTGVNGNPWGYNFTPGNVITNPPGGFCSYFNCIASFWNGNGYVEECQDGMYSLSGGISGSCSRHGGDWRPLYSH